MIREMAATVCQCCGEARRIAGLLRRRPLRFGSSWQPDQRLPVRRHNLCGVCERWLRGILDEVQSPESKRRTPLLGAPSRGGRLLVFEDQCQVCLAVPQGQGAMVDCVAAETNRESWQPLFVCPSCDAWIGSLAEDGRSARGGASRVIDGGYGDWPHPNLRELRVTIEAADRAAIATIQNTCETMGVRVVPRAEQGGAVLFIEASPGASIVRALQESLTRTRARVVLAPMGAARELREALAAGASHWLTLPITPQQVTAGLATATRTGIRINWDERTCLPIVSLEENLRPAIAFTPMAGTDLFTLAWLLRRFARGYDDVVSSGGQVVLLPRAPAGQLDMVKSRLEIALAGRCQALVLTNGQQAPYRRIDLAG